MAWLTEKELAAFKRVGRDVKISDEALIYGRENIEVGDNVRIDAKTVVLASKGYLRIGSHVHVGVGCLLAAGGGIRIGDFAGLSFGVTIISASDDCSGQYLVGPQFPDFFRKVNAMEVNIADFAFLGANSMVGVGSTVSQGSMLGMGTVLPADEVTKPWQVYFGVPARRIGPRDQEMIKKSIEMMEWFEQHGSGR